MYQLYIANKNYSSWSLRPWILLSECQIPFEEHLVTFDQADNSEKFRRFSPNGKVPCLHDQQHIVWDSLAITEYVAEQYPQVWPENVTARAYARCASAEMHSGFGQLRNLCPMNVGVRVKMHSIPAPLQAELARLEALWLQGLAQFGGPFLAGQRFSAVDAFFAPVAFRVQSYQLPLSGPAQAYVETLLALPGMQAWQQAALVETSRESSHEQETLAAGTLVQDLRVR